MAATKTKKGWCVRVPDSIVNTGLDSAVFPTKKDAECAKEVLSEVYEDGVDSDVHRADKSANTTFRDWNEIGW